MKKRYRLFSALLLAVVLSLAMSTVAFADTDGTEPKLSLIPISEPTSQEAMA